MEWQPAASPLQRTSKRPQQFLALSGKLGRKYIISPRNTLVDKETLVNLWSAIPCNVIIACFKSGRCILKSGKSFFFHENYSRVQDCTLKEL